MKFRAFAIIAAFAVPALASAAQPAQAQPSSPTSQPNPGADTNRDQGTTGKTAKLSDAEVRVIEHIHHVNQMEINLGKEAEKSGTARIKDYARMLVNDHQNADKELQAFAKAHKLNTIPADKPMTDAERQDEKDTTTALAHLKTLKGADFDKEFLNIAVSQHDKQLAWIDTAMSSVNDPDLKSWMQTFKATLQRHADQARDLQKSPQAAAEHNKSSP
jgi:putative membrane protein